MKNQRYWPSFRRARCSFQTEYERKVPSAARLEASLRHLDETLDRERTPPLRLE